MTSRERESEPFVPRLISQNADRDIDIARAKQQVARQLANVAAAFLRTMAGSPSAAPTMQSILGLVDAQRRLASLTGNFLDQEEERQALRLMEAQRPSRDCDTRYREWEYAVGMENIVRGALRLAAHQTLQEREHFGGKYSTRAIEEGIALILRATKGPQIRKRNRRKAIKSQHPRFSP